MSKITQPDATRFRSGVAEEPEQVRILYVEDDPAFAHLSVTCLEDENDRFSITTTTDAMTGLELLTEDIDCIVSDYNMPGMDGIEFLKSVRESHPTLPFILFTGRGSEEIASEAISAGVTDYLQKEVGIDQFTILANRIRNAVEKQQVQEKLARQNERLDTVVRNAPLILFALDSEGVFTFSEGNGLAKIGFEPGEVVGRSVFDVFAAADDILADTEQALNGEQTTTTHEVAGSIFKTTYNPVFDDDGTVRTVIGVATDITERVERDQAIEELHRTAQALMEAETVETIAEITVDTVCEILEMPGSGIHLYDEDNGLVPVAWSEQTEDLVGTPPTFEPDEGIAWIAYETGTEQVYEDVSIVSERYNPDTDVRSQMILPLDGYGVLLIASPDANAFDDTDLGLARTLAAHTTTALDQVDSKQALQKTKERLQKIFKHTNDAIILFDLEDEIVLDANPAACEMLDYERQELLSLSPTTIHPHEIDRFWEFVDLVCEEGTGWTDELSCITKTGDQIPAEVSASAIEFDEGQYVLAVIRDISERKQYERKLERERDRYATLFDSLPNPVLHARVEDGLPVIQNVNPAFERTFGYDAEMLRDEKLHDNILPDDQIEETDQLNRQILEEGEVRTEVRRETTDGVRTFQFDCRLRNTDKEEPEGYAVYTDITERVERKRELEILRTAIDHAHIPMTLADPSQTDNPLVYVNDAFEEVTGYSRSEAVGNNCRFLQGEQTDPENVAVLREAIEKEKPVTVDLRNYRKDGELFWNRLTVRPIYDDDGELLRYLGSQQDITEQKESRQRIEHQNERLDEFASVISHDLRNPLQVATGRLELAAEEGDSEHLAAVADAHDRMETLIQDLLTVAREGTSVDEMVPVQVQTVVQQCWQTVETEKATLAVETEQTLRADPTRFQQLLENLVRNAIEHGGDDVHIVVGECDNGTGFYVADDGPGIPEADRERVFDSGYSTDTKGTGFGLAIVQAIVRDHAWDITVTESVDGGARFEITGVERS